MTEHSIPELYEQFKEICMEKNKIIFPEKVAKIIAKATHPDPRHGSRIVAYKCKKCPGWHLTAHGFKR